MVLCGCEAGCEVLVEHGVSSGDDEDKQSLSKIQMHTLAIEKLEIGKNWRFWYNTSHFEILWVHDLLQHLVTAGEITQQE